MVRLPDAIFPFGILQHHFSHLQVMEIALPIFRLSRLIHQMEVTEPLLVAQGRGRWESQHLPGIEQALISSAFLWKPGNTPVRLFADANRFRFQNRKKAHV